MTQEKNYHTSAKELVLLAAEQSGLLKHIAEGLWYANKHGTIREWCIACKMLEELTGEFDAHVLLAHGVIEDLWGGGLADIAPPPGSEHEVNRFIG
jgi:hypothetical protein